MRSEPLDQEVIEKCVKNTHKTPKSFNELGRAPRQLLPRGFKALGDRHPVHAEAQSPRTHPVPTVRADPRPLGEAGGERLLLRAVSLQASPCYFVGSLRERSKAGVSAGSPFSAETSFQRCASQGKSLTSPKSLTEGPPWMRRGDATD